MLSDPTLRFSSRVEDYVKYRPSYPPEVIACLQRECGLTPEAVIADIGCGPGQLAKLFLENRNKVYGVEPNREMREAGEQRLRSYPQFHAVEGRAEATSLAGASVDFVVAGQAFHWFDHDAARKEFLRILKPGGWVVLVWNDRRLDSTTFLRLYEQLLVKYGTDYGHVKHEGQQIDKTVLPAFFGRSGFRRASFDNLQRLNMEGLRGRLRSASYIPESGHPRYAAMMQELEKIFSEHQINGKVDFEHDARMYYGQLSRE
jgi:ubiquinone/menaquinone biosynthesis C-methylase UbiE